MNETSEREYHKDMLDMLTWSLETEIANYAIEETEDLEDEEYGMLVRNIKWNRGTSYFNTVLTPYGHIRWVEETTPKNLLLQIFQVSMNNMVDLVGDICVREKDSP